MYGYIQNSLHTTQLRVGVGMADLDRGGRICRLLAALEHKAAHGITQQNCHQQGRQCDDGPR